VNGGRVFAGRSGGYDRAMGYGRGPSLFTIIYLVVGAFVASDRGYFENVNKIEEVAEAALAVVLWPLVLLDVSMRF
jgi:hypothetical protein